MCDANSGFINLGGGVVIDTQSDLAHARRMIELFAAINWSQTDINAWGDPGSYPAYGPMWAQVSMTPFSQYKGWVGEGGVRNALIVGGAAVKRAKGSINDGLMSVADIVPTARELYNLALDASERHNVAAQNPEKVRELLALWDQYVRDNNVLIPDRSMFETLDDRLPPRVPDDAGYPPLKYKTQFVPPKDMSATPKP